VQIVIQRLEQPLEDARTWFDSLSANDSFLQGYEFRVSWDWHAIDESDDDPELSPNAWAVMVSLLWQMCCPKILLDYIAALFPAALLTGY
jgi:hypothetical protein